MKRILTTFIALALASPTVAQDWKGVGRMSGKVVDAGGKPIAGATVKLDCAARGGGPTLTSDKKGNWAFLGLAGCDWNVEITAEGYNGKAVVVNMPSEQLRMAPVNLTLDKPAGPPPELLEAVKKGDEAFAAQQWTVARENYEKILEMRPEVGPMVFPKLARTYAGEGNTAKAIEYLEKSIATDPGKMELRFAAAQTALDAGLKEKGMEFLNGIDEAAVTTSDGYFNVAVSFLKDSDMANSIAYFSKAISKDEKLGDAYYWRGMCYLRENKLDEAKVDMQKVLDLDPAGQYADKAKTVLEQLKPAGEN